MVAECLASPDGGQTHRAQAATALPGRPHLAGVRYVDTVSYTHLRAHETVLDLVCRLLLEKKKNTHTHTRF